jgi:hypothetical protein
MSGLVNWYEQMPKEYQEPLIRYPNYDKVHLRIPMRCAIVGSSGSGKSNTLLNIIMAMNCWSVIIMAVKCPEEPLYKFFIETIRKIEKRLSTAKHPVSILTVVTEVDEVPPVNSFDKTKQSLVIFDDMIGEKDAKLKSIADFWTWGRKQMITTIFISQSYFMIPKTIRKNCDVLAFKNIGTNRDLKTILSEYTKLDKSVEDLKRMYQQCRTTDITSCFLIDMQEAPGSKWTYRCNFTPLLEGTDDDEN